jgi:hypothetical protein
MAAIRIADSGSGGFAEAAGFAFAAPAATAAPIGQATRPHFGRR